MLNETQLQVKDAHEGELIVYAGPGSGKSHTVIERTASMLEDGVDPNQILLITFTVDACDELRKRLNNCWPSCGVNISTIHSLGHTILSHAFGDNIPTLIDDTVAFTRYVECCNNNGWRASKDGYLQMTNLKSTMGKSGTNLLQEYTDLLIKNNEMDLQDLVSLTVKLLSVSDKTRKFWSNRWKYITVDEAHDCTPAEAKLINLLKNKNLCLILDAAQELYEWRGAKLKSMLDIVPNAHVYNFPLSYRCPQNIYDKAWNLIAPFISQEKMTCVKERGEIGFYKELPKVEDDSMILCRTQNEVSLVEGILNNKGIKTNQKPGIYDSSEASILLSYARLAGRKASERDWEVVLSNPNTNDRRKIYKRAMRAFTKTGFDLLINDWKRCMEQIEGDVSMIDTLTESFINPWQYINTLNKYRMPKTNIRVLTLHGSKGLEAKNVILYNSYYGHIPHYKETNIMAERRLFYVGMTRASQSLSFVIPQGKSPSQFISEAKI